MADQRRRRPGRGRTTPVRPRRSRAGHSAEQAVVDTGAGRAQPHRSRITGRSVVLFVVLAVLAVSYASSLRAYLDQRSHIADLKSDIARSEEAINQLEEEKQRWQDPAFVAQQARERLGYVGPGERSYVVLDEKGDPLEAESSLRDPGEVLVETPDAWWSDVWSSVEVAGNPPKKNTDPAETIDGTQEGDSE